MSKERKNVDKGISFSFWTMGKNGSYCFFFWIVTFTNLKERVREGMKVGRNKGKGRKIAD